MPKKKKKPYDHNNVDAIQGCPHEWFEAIPFDQFLDWRVYYHELPSSVACIIREQNVSTGKVKEYVYKRHKSAQKKVRQIMDKGESIITFALEDEVHCLEPIETEPYDDPLN